MSNLTSLGISRRVPVARVVTTPLDMSSRRRALLDVSATTTKASSRETATPHGDKNWARLATPSEKPSAPPARVDTVPFGKTRRIREFPVSAT